MLKEAKIVRKLGKPALQTLSMYETVSCFTGVFNGPADTEFGFKGAVFKVKKVGKLIFLIYIYIFKFT